MALREHLHVDGLGALGESRGSVATYKNIKNDDASRYLPSDEQIRRKVEMAEREFIEGLNNNSTSETKNLDSEE